VPSVLGLMQDVPLTMDLLLRRARDVGGAFEVVSATDEGVPLRTTWNAVAQRVLRLCNVLDGLGLARGARVGTFAWNTHRHLELYLAAPCSGRVLHAVNVRLHPDDVAYVIDHAGDEVVFVDASLTAALAPVRERARVARYVVMEDGGEVHPAFAGDPRYEELMAAAPADHEPPALDERDAASICFTSGTTGRPKGVVYSHRSVMLHTMALLMADAHAVRQRDVVLPFTPMFHVNCWGLPYACALAPAKLVLTGRDLGPESVAALIERERVTVAAGVPTVWIRMLAELESPKRDTSSLRRVLCGGAEATQALVDRYRALGISVFHGWGATEMSPSGTGAEIDAHGPPDQPRWGRAQPMVELRLTAGDGGHVPWDDHSIGELEARGPWVASAYLNPDDDANTSRFAPDGWFRTGDIAAVAPDGRVRIVDRARDLIKSGGEWIPSSGLESAIASHPAVAEVAVIAVAHDELGERPAAFVVPAAGAHVDAGELRAFLRERVARWWLPDVVEVVGELPKTGVGKYDKRALRAAHAQRLAAVLAGRR
jgi:fatty-acyl-CoA synthase